MKKIRAKETFCAEVYFSPLCVHKFEIFSRALGFGHYFPNAGKNISNKPHAPRMSNIVEYILILLYCL